VTSERARTERHWFSPSGTDPPWAEVEGTVTQNSDGSFTINASVDHFTVFSVFHRPDRGTFTLPLRDTGFTFTIWGGGNLEALEAALPVGGTVWTW